MAEAAQPWTEEQLQGDACSKKELVTFLQASGSHEFLMNHKLKGALKNVAKTRTKDQLVAAYKELFSTKAFKKEGEEDEAAPHKANVDHVTQATKKLQVKDAGAAAKEPPKYTKNILKKGDKSRIPKKGDGVACFYVGRLQDGTVFDTNEFADKKKGRRGQPLKFKVGCGRVIRGWDEALLTMCLGEKAEITIQPEWAYGKKGVEGKIAPNTTLIFEVELDAIE